MGPEIRPIKPDAIRAADLVRTAELRAAAIELLPIGPFSTIIAEGRYEIIKELITALMLLDGWMTLSHESLIRYLAENYVEFTDEELDFLDGFRKLRNDIGYRGQQVAPEFLKRHEEIISEITEKLTALISHHH